MKKKVIKKVTVRSVSIVIHTFGLGGAEQFITQLAENLIKQGIIVELWTNHGPLLQLLEKKSIPARKVSLAIEMVGDWKGLIKAVLLYPLVLITDGWMVWQTRKSDVILLSGFSQKLTVSWWTALLRRPLVWTEFGPLESVLHKFFQLPKIMYYLAKKLPQLIIVPSRHTFHHLISGAKVDSAKLRFVACAVSADQKVFSKVKTIPNRVVCVSRLQPGKGQDRLIIALRAVVNAIPEAQLRIVGEGGFAVELQELINKYQLEKNVKLIGWVPNSFIEMKQASICVTPSTWALEGFGLTVVEAMMLGKPVITFDCPPLNELIESGRTGITVEDDPADNERQLSTAIIRLLRDAQLREKIGRSAKKQAKKRYSFERIGTDYIRVLEEAIELRNAQDQLRSIGWSNYNE